MLCPTSYQIISSYLCCYSLPGTWKACSHPPLALTTNLPDTGGVSTCNCPPITQPARKWRRVVEQFLAEGKAASAWKEPRGQMQGPEFCYQCVFTGENLRGYVSGRAQLQWCFLSLQDLTGSELYTQAASLLHPVVYTTAIILLLCLLAVIVSYMYHHRWDIKPGEYRTLMERSLFYISLG